MPTTKPQKSVNLPVEDWETAKRVAAALTTRIRTEYAGTPAEEFFATQKFGIKAAIHYGLIRAAQELEINLDDLVGEHIPLNSEAEGKR